MLSGLRVALEQFVSSHGFTRQGKLCVALVVTKHAREKGLPLDPNTLVTQGGGQVIGLGKSSVQSVLKEHGIKRVLAAEGGRTSRGSIQHMREYVDFLNDLNDQMSIDLAAIEKIWIEHVHAFFASKPFIIKLDPNCGLRHVVRGILEQAYKRQQNAPGMHYAGAVLQHLVGAKLDCAFGEGRLEHNSFSTADAPSDRPGDFLIGDAVVHVTTSPGEMVVKRCHENLNSGYKPILVTIQQRTAVAEGLAEDEGVADRVDIFEIEQFLALNLYEFAKFLNEERRTAIEDLVSRYNEIVEMVETDPSLRIEIQK